MIFFFVFQKNWVLGYSLSNKTWWKPHFPMGLRPLVKGGIANFVIFLDVSEFLLFWWFFPFFKKIGFLGILGPPFYGIRATIRIGWEILFLRMRDFLTVLVLEFACGSQSQCFVCLFIIICILWQSCKESNKNFSQGVIKQHESIGSIMKHQEVSKCFRRCQEASGSLKKAHYLKINKQTNKVKWQWQ